MIDRTKKYIKKHVLLIYSFVTAAAILAFCSKSSPLYPMNDWVDVHCFLTLGKGLLNGLVPYVDLYEQKGPVLYFIYALVSLFSQESMFGQYLLEVITFGLFLYFSAKLAEIYLGKSKFLYPIVAVLAAVVATTRSFSHGGSVEQMCLFLFVYGLYSVLKACHENRPLSFREALTNGVFAGMAFWIKYTMLGFYLGLALFVLIWYIGWVRDFKKLLAVIGQFLLGIGAVSAVVLVYFLCVGGLDELFTCYFYNNIFLYTLESDVPKLTQVRESFTRAMEYNNIFPIFLYLGLGWLILRAHKGLRDLIAVVLSFAGLVIGTYMGTGYVYYALVLSAFTVFGLIGIAWLLQRTKKATLLKFLPREKTVHRFLIAAALIYCTVWAFTNSDNTYLMDYDREDMPQYRFANIINETEDATLLNFGFLDGGFYYAADVLPTCPFFCTFNVNAPGMWDTQYEYVREGMVDYVITRHYRLDRYNVDSSKYELVDTAELYFEGIDFTYYLYRLKGDTR